MNNNEKALIEQNEKLKSEIELWKDKYNRVRSELDEIMNIKREVKK